MEPDLVLSKLIRWFEERGSGGLIVAFSGGVDSTLVAAAARRALGNSALAITVETDFMAKGEKVEAASVAKALGIGHRVLPLSLPDDLRGNPADRCYRCKGLMMRALKGYAREHGQSLVVDGTNYDDLHSGRAGLRALREEGIASPLAELGLGKEEVRAVSKYLGLGSDRPSSPCLATRFPAGHRITRPEVERVAKAEEFLRGMGFREVRVRVRGSLAKIEVSKDELVRMMEEGRYGPVAAELKRLGFQEVTLDLEGYRPEPSDGKTAGR